MIFLLAYLYVRYVIFLPMVMHMYIKLVNTFGNRPYIRQYVNMETSMSKLIAKIFSITTKHSVFFSTDFNSTPVA